MGLNIKKASTEAAIRELAARTGESLTAAVEGAVLDKLVQLRGAQKRETFEEMLAWVKELQDSLKAKKLDPNDTRSGQEIVEEMYDENGLPI